jgi:tRNA (guanine37-N1)-methyltransferase
VEIDIFTLFPEWFEWFTAQRHVSNSLAGSVRLACVNFREHTPLSAGQVDDTPFGGGAGMLLRVDVVESALRARYDLDPVELPSQRRVIALTPGGRLLDDALVDELSGEPALTLLCGRYEGFDERIIEHFASEQISIGRYVLSGGELASPRAPGSLRRIASQRTIAASSSAEESFSVALGGEPEYPHYTRPAEHRGWHVPEVLLSGHHERIAKWRRERSRERAERLDGAGG